jgi:hypothetical protein
MSPDHGLLKRIARVEARDAAAPGATDSPERQKLNAFLNTEPSYDAMIEYFRDNRIPADMERACELIYGDPMPTALT